MLNHDAEMLRLVARERQEQLRREAERARRQAVAAEGQPSRARLRLVLRRRAERRVANA